MTDSPQHERLPALGDAEPVPEDDNDFAGEHDTTAVDREVTDGDHAEQESPRGWSGLDRDGPP